MSVETVEMVEFEVVKVSGTSVLIRRVRMDVKFDEAIRESGCLTKGMYVTSEMFEERPEPGDVILIPMGMPKLVKKVTEEVAA